MSKFIVSARKYRPQRFDEVIGQEHVTHTLKNALQNDQLAHAFLFCGPRGIGKTTCARILAKVLNCEAVTEDSEPCNQCDSCNAFDHQSSFNIIELDAASHNTVDHIRTLIDQVRFQPQQGQYKVFIIDEVHMLSASAFNAFLKTLEEPPPYAVFILATTEKHKIIPTILSRCQVYDFRRIQTTDIVKHLESICNKESIKADMDGLHIIAQKADGALRDALSIFDRLASYSGKEITYNSVIENLNVLDYDYYFKAVDALLVEDASKILLLFDQVLANGFEADTFINGLATHIRDLLICQDSSTLKLLDGSESLKKRYSNQAQVASRDFLLNVLHLANECDIHFARTKNKRLHSEIYLIKMTYFGSQKIIKGVAVQEKKTQPESRPPQNQKEDQPRINPEIISENKSSLKENKEQEEVIQVENSSIEITPDVKTNTPIAPDVAPSLLSLEAIDATIPMEDALPNNGENIVNEDNIKKAWDAYCASAKSPALKTMLKNADLRYDGENMIATVGSKVSRAMLLQESELMNQIRESLNSPELILIVEVDATKSANGNMVEKPLTNKEKYNMLVKKNPAVKSLKEKFDLKVDND